MSVLTGRRKLVTQFSSDDIRDNAENLANMFNTAKAQHEANRIQIQYLMGYHKGVQPILGKTKEIRPEINNITVLNHAFMITRTIVGYFLGTPIQYIQAKDTGKEEIEELNDFIGYEGKHSVDTEIGENQSICGVGYRIILTDNEDEAPFEDRSLDPRTTFVIYENNIKGKPVAGCTFFEVLNDFGTVVNARVYIYTEYGVYDILTDHSGTINDASEINFTSYNVGGVPIIEYPNNSWRMGDWEHVLSLMDDINELQSGRMDDIEQLVESLLVFVNADIDEETYNEMRASGVVMLKNNTMHKSQVDIISNPLDQTGMNMYAKELQELLYSLAGIPSRDNRSGGGGDTGEAVELRDGWADLEIVARGKEAGFKKSEKRTLNIILTILRNKQATKLNVSDVDIKFSRNKNHNLLVKTQSYSTLLATQTLTPSDCLTIVDLVSDVNEYANRGEDYWGSANELDDDSADVQVEEI